MNIGWIGLGKLGLPCSVAIAEKGHDIYGYDVNRAMIEVYKEGKTDLFEPDMDKRLIAVKKKMHFVNSVQSIVEHCDIIFVAVQTPHPPELDGSVRHRHVRKDFDYSYLINACIEIGKALSQCDSMKHIAIVSTVLPGTVRQKIYPAMANTVGHENWRLYYNPSFIAMGETIENFTNPEFCLIGIDGNSAEALVNFYNTIHSAPKIVMAWEEAEMVKMLYNTFIGLKIVFSNMVMQMCQKIGADCDVIMGALLQAKRRLISERYLRPGMGDGGSCHPRDSLAMSLLSDSLGLSYNLFDEIMTIREKQTEWLADLMCQYDLPKVILGKTYKPNTNLTAGSASLLLSNILKERGIEVQFCDPVVGSYLLPNYPCAYLVATPWIEFRDIWFVKGSVVLDPWAIIDPQDDIEVIPIGRMAYKGVVSI